MAKAINGWVHCRVNMTFGREGKTETAWHPFSFKLKKVYAFKKHQDPPEDETDELLLSGKCSVIWLNLDHFPTTIDIAVADLRSLLEC